MKDRTIYLLSTRPLDTTLVEEALKRDIIIENISFIKTASIVDNDISEEIKELASKSITAVFTSMNGAEAVIEVLAKNAIQPGWKIYCIGSATQSIIRKYFKAANIVGNGRNAAELSETIIENGVKEAVFFCGNKRREELPEQLQQKNIVVEEIVVYETIEVPLKVDKKYNGILFFSPSAVKSFFSVNSIHADTVLFSIGDTTASEIKKYSHNKIIVSDFPAKDKLVEIATDYFRKTNNPND
jgi:uroporphyrinogen-III synthase